MARAERWKFSEVLKDGVDKVQSRRNDIRPPTYVSQAPTSRELRLQASRWTEVPDEWEFSDEAIEAKMAEELKAKEAAAKRKHFFRTAVVRIVHNITDNVLHHGNHPHEDDAASHPSSSNPGTQLFSGTTDDGFDESSYYSPASPINTVDGEYTAPPTPRPPSQRLDVSRANPRRNSFLVHLDVGPRHPSLDTMAVRAAEPSTEELLISMTQQQQQQQQLQASAEPDWNEAPRSSPLSARRMAVAEAANMIRSSISGRRRSVEVPSSAAMQPLVRRGDLTSPSGRSNPSSGHMLPSGIGAEPLVPTILNQLVDPLPSTASDLTTRDNLPMRPRSQDTRFLSLSTHGGAPHSPLLQQAGGVERSALSTGSSSGHIHGATTTSSSLLTRPSTHRLFGAGSVKIKINTLPEDAESLDYPMPCSCSDVAAVQPPGGPPLPTPRRSAAGGMVQHSMGGFSARRSSMCSSSGVGVGSAQAGSVGALSPAAGSNPLSPISVISMANGSNHGGGSSSILSGSPLASPHSSGSIVALRQQLASVQSVPAAEAAGATLGSSTSGPAGRVSTSSGGQCLTPNAEKLLRQLHQSTGSSGAVRGSGSQHSSKLKAGPSSSLLQSHSQHTAQQSQAAKAASAFASNQATQAARQALGLAGPAAGSASGSGVGPAAHTAADSPHGAAGSKTALRRGTSFTYGSGGSKNRRQSFML